ncbi:MAG TPA: ATP-binding protein [Kofleriaceae bacterium]|nr:ATP-binding protein [Kofleriaceae bacterium]
MPGPSDRRELMDRLERVRVLLAHAWDVRRNLAGAAEVPVRGALQRFLHENVEPGFVPRAAEVDRALAAIDLHVAELVGETATPFTRLIAAAELSEMETDLLLAALAPETRRGFREAMMLLGPEAAPGVHPAAHLVELVSASDQDYARARSALEDGARLLARGVLRAAPLAPLSPPLWRAITPSVVTRTWLDGSASPYPLLDDAPELRRLVAEPLAQALARLADQPVPRVLLVGEPGSGRTRAAAALAALLDRRAAITPPGAAIAEAVLDATLRRRLLFVDARNGALAAGDAEALARAELPCAVCAPAESELAARLSRLGFARVDVAPAPLALQVRAWGLALHDRVPAQPLGELVRGHALGLGAIEEAAAQALVAAGPDASASALLGAAERAARTVTSDRLAQIADRLSTTLTWDDLVLPDEVRAEVDEVWRAAAARRQVFEQWGFEQRTPYGRAVSALFTGEPGTGKTMCATLVARELGVELYRVDLSKMVDKYIGETEKHLATLFAEAERGRCVLLFDEADSLFGKRTKGGESATERYANLEVNYLLQRIETFSGIVILTTNQESVIDDAFKRRLRYRVSFPFPSEDERELMWRRLIPPEAPVGPDLDPSMLARKYRLSGGHMKSAVLRAAFAAAAASQPISQAHLVHAANQELENIGKLVVG